MRKVFLFLFLTLILNLTVKAEEEDIEKLLSGVQSAQDANIEEKKVEIKENTEEKKDAHEKKNEHEEEDVEKLLSETTTQYDWEELDPFEEHNKNILSLNMLLLRRVMLPTVFFVDSWVPKKARIGYTNFINNLIEPRNIFIYDRMKNPKKTRVVVKRFLTNTVFGVFGLINVAELRWGSEYKSKRMSLDCIFRKNHKIGRYVIVPVTNQYFERPLVSDTFDILMNPTFYFQFPFNYLMYIMDKVVLLGKDKTLLYRNRKYNEGVYNALSDAEIYSVLNEDCA
jgi:ABC-type transporter lipoprotein component MlaA